MLLALGFAGGAGTGKVLKLLFKTPIPKPLTNRTLTVRPELFSQEIRAIEAMQQPFYRGGFVTDKTAMKLAERNVQVIKEIEKFVGKGSRGFYNEAGDIIIESKDGLRQFRIDLLHTYPHKNPHSHIIRYEYLKNKKLKIGDKRIYPKGVTPK